MREYYHPQEDIRSPSPDLKPITINYKPEETPQPYISTSSSSASSQSPLTGDERGDHQLETSIGTRPVKKEGKKRKRKSRHRPCQGDAVLITYLDPNRPDIAREAGQNALNSASQSEAEYDQEKDMRGAAVDDDEDNEHDDRFARASKLKNTASAALEDAMIKETTRPWKSQHSSAADISAASGQKPTVMKNLPRSWHPPVSLTISAPSTGKTYEADMDSIASSPALGKYTIPADEANRDSILPAMHKSPPRTASAYSPEGSQSLPSLHTALSRIADDPLVETPSDISPFTQPTGRLPSVIHPASISGNPVHPGLSPSGYSQPSPNSSKDMTNMSPPGYTNSSNSWRSASNQGSFTLPSSTSMATLTPITPFLTPKEEPSPIAVTSPQQTSTSTTTITTTTAWLPVPPPPPPPPPSPSPAVGAGGPAVNRPFASNTFKCTHPGCTAEPFQTQYLLNSHANVHSSSRPYYCPVEGCSHSVGGKGFKRKNEMNRHSLVHSSPGYACPFCSDQQHKYPRPDNLQRHVRVHHPDKERDNAELRAVLALRSSTDSGNGNDNDNHNDNDNTNENANSSSNNSSNHNHNRGRRRRTSGHPVKQQVIAE